MSRKNVAGVILAGGRSSRMGGGDKTLLMLGRRPVLGHVIDCLRPQVEALALNANGDPARFAEIGLPVLADATPDFKGPLAGILAGLRWASGANSFSWLITVAGDTPFFPDDLVARLCASAANNRGIVMAGSGGRTHPVFALWPLALCDDLAAFIADGRSLKVADFASRHPVEHVQFCERTSGGRAIDPFFNLNTPDDVAMARDICAEERR